MNFKNKLQLLIERDSVSVPKLAEATGISSQTIYSILKRDSHKTKLSHLRKFCDFFDCSLDYLVDDNVTDPDYGKRTPPTSNIFHISKTEPEKGIQKYPPEMVKEIENHIDLLKLKYEIKD